ncbi:MAG: MAPEG family protein [Woeseiaceae bacterium]|nr:MAPEG family protein [Woeseiaceae bacterium]
MPYASTQCARAAWIRSFSGPTKATTNQRHCAHSRHLVNLYEAPTLFYVIVVIAFVTGQSGLLPAILAWAYVALRCAHSYVHLTSNTVRRRFRLFLASLVILVTLWFTVFVGILLTAPAR